MNEYIVILEPSGDGSWGAYVPDLPGCTSGGATRKEAARNVREAIRQHVQLLREAGQRVPTPSVTSEVVRVQ